MMDARPAEPARPASARLRWLRGPWVAGLLGVTCYLNTLDHGFTYDDGPLVVRNTRIRTLTDLRGIWLSDWWKESESLPGAPNTWRDRLYRPLTLLSLAINYRVHGLQPYGYHAANVALHAVACVLVWHLARRLTGSEPIAALAGALFAIHPVHVEAVASIVGRAEILATLGLLAGLLILAPLPPPGSARDAPGLARGGLAALAFLAALFCKETAICYPAIAALLLYARQAGPGDRPQLPTRSGRARWLLLALILLAPLAVYFPLRYVALDGHLFRAEPADSLMSPLVAATPLERVLGPFTILGHYTRLLLIPADLVADYGRAIIEPSRGIVGMTILGFAAAGGLLALLAGFFRRGSPVWHTAAVLAAMFLASYALISNTVLLIGVSVAERLMYWPSVPVLILVALAILEFWRRQCAPGRPLAARAPLLAVLGGLVLAALAVRSVVRNADWSHNLRLFQTDVALHPEGAHLNRCLAAELADLAARTPDRDTRTQILELADQHLQEALKIDSGFADALALRGQILAELGHTGDALAYLDAALKLRPEHVDARRTLALIMHGQQNPERLESLRQRAAENPEDPGPRKTLGRMLLEYGDAVAAIPPLEEAVRLAPEDVDALRLAARAHALTDSGPRAIELFEHVLELAPDDWEAHANLSTLLAERDPAATLRHAERAFALQPDDVRVAGNLAEAYAVNGRTAEAIAQYRRVERGLDSDDPMRRIIAERIARLERTGR